MFVTENVPRTGANDIWTIIVFFSACGRLPLGRARLHTDVIAAFCGGHGLPSLCSLDMLPNEKP